jgi:hypothetical protein
MSSGTLAVAKQHEPLEREHAEVNNNFRTLMEVRFKLLAFLPGFRGLDNFSSTVPPRNDGYSDPVGMFFGKPLRMKRVRSRRPISRSALVRELS